MQIPPPPFRRVSTEGKNRLLVPLFYQFDAQRTQRTSYTLFESEITDAISPLPSVLSFRRLLRSGLGLFPPIEGYHLDQKVMARPLFLQVSFVPLSDIPDGRVDLPLFFFFPAALGELAHGAVFSSFFFFAFARLPSLLQTAERKYAPAVMSFLRS